MHRLLPTLLTLALLTGLVALFRVVQRYDPSVGSEPGYREDDLGDIAVRFERVVMLSRAQGETQWRLRADRIDLRRAPGGGLDDYHAAEFQRVHDGVFYRNGRPEAHFAAQQATFDQSVRRFFARGHIRVRSAKDDRLEAEEMVWAERDDTVDFPRGAKGVLRGHSVTAPRLLYSLKERTVRCPQGARGLFNGYDAQAAGLFWDVERDRVRCVGPVSAKRKNLSLLAQEAEFDLKKRAWRANKVTLRLRIEGENDEWEGLE